MSARGHWRRTAPVGNYASDGVLRDAARRRAPRGKQCYRKVMNCQYGPARNMFTTVASATGRRKLLTLQRIHGYELSRDAVDLTM